MTAAKRYWEALEARDAVAMAACYSAGATFKDPVFDLAGPEIARMWSSLFSSAHDLNIKTGDLVETDGGATGTWEAWYTFSSTGRAVHNRITSTFTERGGRIVAQHDHFPFWLWSRQALGWKGFLLGWTPLLRNAVRRQAEARLARHP